MRNKRYFTVKGQEIFPVPMTADTVSNGMTYRYYQLSPPLPQRFEWIRLDHVKEIVEISKVETSKEAA